MAENAVIELPRNVTPEASAPITPMAMIDRALSSGASAETLERLMALQERWQAAQAKRAFDAAIAEAKAEISPILKTRKVDFTSAKGRTNYDYEDLAQIENQVNPVLSRHGLSYRFRSEQPEARAIKVTCIVSHRDGHSEENSLLGWADDTGNKNAIQAVGSAITYLQRYSLKLALGLSATNDTDGRTLRHDDATSINADQYQDLCSLIERSGADEKAMLQFLGAQDTETLTVAQYGKAKALLEKKIAKKALDAKKAEQ